MLTAKMFWSPGLYLHLKALHVVAIISWMAGLLYLYRLFIYHRLEGPREKPIHQLFMLMEKRLLLYITIPAMVVSVLTGAGMIALNAALAHQAWFHLKLGGVLGMIAMTGYAWVPLLQFRREEFTGFSDFSLRVLNEVPTLFMILIVWMVILKPQF